MAHLGSSMQWCHPVIGSDAWIRPTILDQVLDDFKVALLAGQVERCGTILSLGVDNAAWNEIRSNWKVNKRPTGRPCFYVVVCLRHSVIGRNWNGRCVCIYTCLYRLFATTFVFFNEKIYKVPNIKGSVLDSKFLLRHKLEKYKTHINIIITCQQVIPTFASGL